MSVMMFIAALENLVSRVVSRCEPPCHSHAGTCSPYCQAVQTSTWYGRIPEVLNGPACKESREECPARPTAYQGHEADAPEAKSSVREDSKILEQDG